MRPGMVVHACNPCTWKLKWEGLEFKASLNHMKRLCHNNSNNLQSHSNMAFTSKWTHRQTE